MFGDGSYSVSHFEYAEQPSPDELVQALSIGKKFNGDKSLGGIILYSAEFTKLSKNAVNDAEQEGKATVFN